MSGIMMMVIAIVTMCRLIPISYWSSVRIHRRCGSDQRTDPGCNLRMAAGTVMDPDRRCILRSSTGFLCNVCFCKK